MSDEKARIETLLGIMREYGLDALTLRVDGSTYELVRRDPAAPAPVAGPIAQPPPAPQQEEMPANARRVTAPLVGVFYRASSPDSDPFVDVGDRVEAGQAICILEAMKMMNEITTDYAGTVTRIIPQNGQLVTAGEDLMWIEP